MVNIVPSTTLDYAYTPLDLTLQMDNLIVPRDGSFKIASVWGKDCWPLAWRTFLPQSSSRDDDYSCNRVQIIVQQVLIYARCLQLRSFHRLVPRLCSYCSRRTFPNFWILGASYCFMISSPRQCSLMSFREREARPNKTSPVKKISAAFAELKGLPLHVSNSKSWRVRTNDSWLWPTSIRLRVTAVSVIIRLSSHFLHGWGCMMKSA